MKTPMLFAGLDLGREQDHSALAVLDGSPGAVWRVRHLRQFPLGTPYTAVLETVARLFRSQALRGRYALAVDASGAGRAVAEMLVAALPKSRVLPVVLTRGRRATRTGDRLCLPSALLVSCLAGLLGARRLQVASGLPLAPRLATELQLFHARCRPSGSQSFAASRGHDDLLFAVALGAWLAEATSQHRHKSGLDICLAAMEHKPLILLH
ncbi:MAG: hypothetical protein IPM24_09480 [Bryobacterales bacterium]|nr:hypothetical protein [Bryobacterales bacterium]